MSTPVQVSPYQPVTFYDTPGILAAQVLDGEASFENFSSLFMGPDRLSLKERDSLQTKMQNQMGASDPISSAIIGIATNPFVWLMFLAGKPAAARAIAAGRSIFTTKLKYSGYTKTGASALDVIGATTPLEAINIPSVNQGLLGVSNWNSLLRRQTQEKLEGPTARLIERLQAIEPKVKSLNPLEHSDEGAQRLLFKVQRNLSARAASFDVPYQELAPKSTGSYIKKFKDGREVNLAEIHPNASPDQLARLAEGERDTLRVLRGEFKQLKFDAEHGHIPSLEKLGSPDARTLKNMEFRDWTDADGLKREYLIEKRDIDVDFDTRNVRRSAAVDSAVVDANFKELGLDEYYDSMQSLSQDRFALLTGKTELWEKSRIYEVDPLKVKKLADGTRNEVLAVGGVSGEVAGRELLATIAGDDIARLINTGQMSDKELTGIIEKIVAPQVNSGGRYMPRNMVKAVEHDSLILTNDDLFTIHDRPQQYIGTTGSVAPLTGKKTYYHPDDIRGMIDEFGESDELLKMLKESQGAATAAATSARPVPILAHRLDFDAQFKRHLDSGAETYAWHIAPVGDDVKAAYREGLEQMGPELRNRASGSGKFPVVPGAKGQVPTLYGQDPFVRGGSDDWINHAMLMKRDHDIVQDTWVRQQIKEVGVAAAVGKSSPPHTAQLAAMRHSKRMIGAFTETSVGRYIEGSSKKGAEFIKSLRHMGLPDTPVFGAGGMAGNLAKYLYVTHLGINLSSVMLNMTQPFLLAGTAVGFRNTIRAYGDAVNEMLTYASKRTKKFGMRPISDLERRRLMEESFHFMDPKVTGGRDIMGIGPNAFATIDSQLGPSALQAKKGFPLAMEYSMKLFEKSEWLNRTVTAHALKHAYRAGGKNYLKSPHFFNDAKRLVLQTQFGMSDLNQPRAFLTNPLLNNPLMRQFLSFPTRSFVGTFSVLPRMGEQAYWSGLMKTAFRGMGASAIAYETGKGLIGADMSRGLFASQATDILGGKRLLEEGNEFIPLPPVIDIPAGFIAGFAQQDMSLISNSLARTLPGGVALNRAMGMLPELPKSSLLADLPGSLQKIYVDYANPLENGQVGVFKADGSLVGFQSPSEIVAKSLGVDLGAFSQQGSLDAYLVKQRDQMVGMRREYLQAMLNNEPGRAQGIQQAFADKFDLPLTVSQRQVEQFLQNRSMSRTERVLDRIPPEARPMFQRMVDASGGLGNVPSQSLLSGSTARKRSREGGAALSPEMRREIQRQMQAQSRREGIGPGPTNAQAQPFDPIQGFRN